MSHGRINCTSIGMKLTSSRAIHALILIAPLMSLAFSNAFAQTSKPMVDLSSTPSVQHDDHSAFHFDPTFASSSLQFKTLDIELDPSPPKPALDRKFVLVELAAFGAIVADAETSVYCLRRNICTEANPLFGTNPSQTRIYATVIPVTAFTVWMDYLVKKDEPHRSSWTRTPRIALVLHTMAAVNNLFVIHYGRNR